MNNNKILFLDIDGVLNVEVYVNAVYEICKRVKLNAHDNLMDDYGMLFCPTAVNMLKHVIEQTGAKIVISSTWRHSGLKIMQEMWTARNLPGEVIGITPTFRNDRPLNDNLPFKERAERGYEVEHYCKEHNITNFAVLDDDDDFLPNQEPRFIQTNERYGITYQDAERAIQILNSET